MNRPQPRLLTDLQTIEHTHCLLSQKITAVSPTMIHTVCYYFVGHLNLNCHFLARVVQYLAHLSRAIPGFT
jgi:hypothetical protein